LLQFLSIMLLLIVLLKWYIGGAWLCFFATFW
jgi:hypothetical protein